MKKRKKESGKEVKEQQTWNCPLCREDNPLDEDVCIGCGSFKEEPSYDQIVGVYDEK